MEKVLQFQNFCDFHFSNSTGRLLLQHYQITYNIITNIIFNKSHRMIQLFWFFITVINSLHLTTNTQIQLYIQKLKQRQNIFNQKLNQLEYVLEKGVKNREGQSIDESIKQFEKLVLNEETILSQIEKSLQLPLDEAFFNCIKTQKTKQIKSGFNQIKQAFSNLLQTIKSLTDQNHISHSLSQFQFLNSQLSTFQNNFNIHPQSLKDQQYQSNLLNDQWILPNESIISLNKAYAKNSREKVVYICPQQTPFAKDNHCINCSPKQYFNLLINDCKICHNYKKQKHECDDKIGINLSSGIDRLILGNDIRVQDLKGDVTCPSQKPFYNKISCMNCESDTPYFHYAQLKCVNCKYNEKYSKEQHTCVKEERHVTNLKVKDSINRIIIGDQDSISSIINQQNQQSSLYKLILCPSSTPFYNGSTCISCPKNSLFDLKNKHCKICDNNTFFSKPLHRCQNYTFYTNLQNGRWASEKNQSQIRQEIKKISKKEGIQKCTLKKPFFNGQNCISCSKGSHFNMETEKCEVCMEKDYFSLNLHRCLKKAENIWQTNPKNSNLIYNGLSQAQWMSKYEQNKKNNQSIMNCPQNTPFWDGHSCIMCPQTNPYFNLKYKICTKCSLSSKYDENVHECLSEEKGIVDQKPNIEKILTGILS